MIIPNNLLMILIKAERIIITTTAAVAAAISENKYIIRITWTVLVSWGKTWAVNKCNWTVMGCLTTHMLLWNCRYLLFSTPYSLDCWTFRKIKCHCRSSDSTNCFNRDCYLWECTPVHILLVRGFWSVRCLEEVDGELRRLKIMIWTPETWSI